MHAALVIDMQEYYLSNVRNPYELIRAQNNLLKVFEKNNYPTAIIEVRKHSPTIQELHLPKSSITKVFKKEDNSAFKGTTLDAWLKDLDVTNLTLMGVTFPFCVLDSAKDARIHGYKVATALDIVSCFRGRVSKEIASTIWFATHGRIHRKHTHLKAYKSNKTAQYL